MNFYYINSKGIKLDFSDYPYLFQEGDLLDYSWSYESVEGSKNKITDVKKGIGERSFRLALLPDFSLTIEERKAALLNAADNVYEVFEQDVISDTDGRLYSSTGFYLPCRVMASSKSNWKNGLPFMFQDFTVVSAKNAWIKEIKKSFFPLGSVEAQNADADYPYDFLYDYAAETSGLTFWNTGHFSPCDFEMTVFGPVVNPKININGNSYTIYTSLNANEYIVINSIENTVFKVTEDGTKINIYDLRGKDFSVFSKLPQGELTVTWNGNFGFDITAFIERSEPKWN